MPAPTPISDSFPPDVAAQVRLSMVRGVGPLIRQKLLDYFGSADGILSAAPSTLQEVSGVGHMIAKRIAGADREIDVESELRIVQENNINLLIAGTPAYPRLLSEIHDPPGVLYTLGELLPSDSLAVGIVGTRRASAYGLRQAERFARNLAKAGFTIVSGLARGIDRAAHEGALAEGGRTIAVLGSGVLKIYPKEHEQLAKLIATNGAVVSEAPPRMEPIAGMFPQRNRIISGLSLGTIVIEAAGRSGSLITAKHANEQGREVFAVPGRIDTSQSRGCHRLIRDGARLVESIDDVMEELGPLVEATPRSDGTIIRNPAELKLNEIETKVLQAIDTDPTSIDNVTVRCGLPIHRVLSTISVLEMRKLIRRVSGNLVARL